MTILHIFTGLTTFLKLGQNCFNNAGIPGKYVVIGKCREDEFQSNGYSISYYQINSVNYCTFLKTISRSEYSLVLFHSLLLTNATVALELIKKYPERPPLAWYIYGSEISMSDIVPHRFHGKYTNRIYYYLGPYRVIIPIQRIVLKILNRSLVSVFKGMDYVVHFIPEEIEYFEQHSQVYRPSLWFIYGNIEDFVGKELLSERVTLKGNILVGNSSSFTSNHAEAFKMISKAPIQDRKIIVPISYGNMRYAEYIKKYGEKTFGNSFMPLQSFMSLSDYNNLFLSCSCVIMNHYRQQALGNILSAAWLGSRIYVNDYTTTYKYFKRIGLNIFSIQRDFNPEDPDVFNAISDEQVMENRIVLNRELGHDSVIRMIQDSFRPFVIANDKMFNG